jgi:C-terminal processing protease CtpA/Prc
MIAEDDWAEQSSAKVALRWLSKKFPAELDTARLAALPLSEWPGVYPQIEMMAPDFTETYAPEGMLVCQERGFSLWRAGKNWLVSDVFHQKARPSEGVRPGMIVSKINGKEIENLSTQELNQILRDANNESLRLHVVDLMKGKETNLELEVNTAKEPAAKSGSIIRQLSTNTFYVKPDYWRPKTYFNIMTGLESLNFLENQTNHLILDLRGVQGDDVAEAAKLLSQWTSNKGELLFSLRGPRFKQVDFKSTGKAFSEWSQIVILADENSGLASALLAAASLSVSDRRVIFNGALTEQWFKETLKLPNGQWLRIPIAEVILPNGKRPHETKPEAGLEQVIPDSSSSYASRPDQQDSLARIAAFNYFVNWSGQLASGNEVLTKEADDVQLALQKNLLTASPILAEPGKEAILTSLTDKAYYYFLGMLAGSPLSKSLLPLYDHQITEALKEIKRAESLK